MITKIKKMQFENFKGYKEKTFDFMGNTKIFGQNGAGKTTIATGYYWVFADRDAELNSNPPITPLGVDEVSPRVEITLDIDGVEITAAKIQKVTKKNGRVSASNTYEVNAVEYGERDFKKKMEEYGFNFDLFLPLSHHDVFTSQKSTEMRKVLFGMVNHISDKDVADMIPEAKEVAGMLANYTMEEVKAMQNANIRKIKEVYGKNGEIVDAQIDGMEKSKIEIDCAELELQKKAIQEEIENTEKKLNDLTKVSDEAAKISVEIMDLKFNQNGIVQKLNAGLVEEKRKLDDLIADKMSEKSKTQAKIGIAERNIETVNMRISCEQKERDSLADQWKAVKAEKFDEVTTICPTCHRPLPDEEIESIKESFGKKKQERLDKIETNGKTIAENIERLKSSIPEQENIITECKEQIKSIDSEIEELKIRLSGMPSHMDEKINPEWNECQIKIEEKEKILNQMENTDIKEIKAHLDNKMSANRSSLVEIEKQLALVGRNAEIDEKIDNLRKKKLELEQQKADSEKILYQLDLVSMKKNQMLTDAVNSHFKIVKFRLFDYLKNGNVVDDCTPMIYGKPINTHANGALRVLAKLDIVDGLQRFYDQYYPVFADDFSLVTSGTEVSIDVDCQLIKLVASDDYKELTTVKESEKVNE